MPLSADVQHWRDEIAPALGVCEGFSDPEVVKFLHSQIRYVDFDEMRADLLEAGCDPFTTRKWVTQLRKAHGYDEA